MKKKNYPKKLKLDKETIANLEIVEKVQLEEIKGGFSNKYICLTTDFFCGGCV